MPVIKVWCLPDIEEDELNSLHAAIVLAACAITELGLSDESDMTILFPADKMKYGLGTVIVIEVTGLLDKPKRTMVVRQKLARNLSVAVGMFFPQAKIESFVYPDDPARDAFWSSENSEPELDEDGMIIWRGGDRPVGVDEIVAVKVQGDIPRSPIRAGEWPQICWRHRPSEDPNSKWNIVAYKVVG